MNAFLLSAVTVAVAELGDKTQLVALCLASRFRKPVPVIAGIAAATFTSHLATGWIGHWAGNRLHGDLLHGLLALSFFAAALWALIPDKLNNTECETKYGSIVATSFITFFLAEMGDKTQLATVALAAQFPSLLAVVMGTSFGMLLVNIPAVLLSHRVLGRLPLVWIRTVSAVVFAWLALYEIAQVVSNS